MADPFWSNLFKRKNIELIQLLHGVPIFEGLNDGELKKISTIIHRRQWSGGEIVVKEGQPGSGMYIIMSGIVHITENNKEGKSLKLAELGPGEFFGEQALLDDSPRNASAIAKEDCIIFGFFRPDLLELIENRPRLGLKIIMHLSHMLSVRLRHTNRLLKEFQNNDSAFELGDDDQESVSEEIFSNE